MKKQKLKCESHRHHYIPQFIIKKFSARNDEFVKYYDKKRDEFLNVPAEDIFWFNDLYREDKNETGNPVQLEEEFSKFEREIAELIRKKISNKREIVLSVDEHESLILFIILLKHRSKNCFDAFVKNEPSDFRQAYGKSCTAEDRASIWRKNLYHICKCRSYLDVMNSNTIDNYFKLYLFIDYGRDSGSHLVVLDQRGQEDFFLSDSYPVYHNAQTNLGSIPLYIYCPITPKRMIMVCANDAAKCKQEVKVFNDNVLIMPTLSNNGKTITIRAKNIYEPIIKPLNDYMFASAHDGIALLDEKHFFAKDRKEEKD